MRTWITVNTSWNWWLAEVWERGFLGLPSTVPLAVVTLWASVCPVLLCTCYCFFLVQGEYLLKLLEIFTELSGVGSDWNCSKETYMFCKKETNAEILIMFPKKNHITFSELWNSFRNWLQAQVLGCVPEPAPGPSPNLANTCPVTSWASVSPPVRSSCEAQGS